MRSRLVYAALALGLVSISPAVAADKPQDPAKVPLVSLYSDADAKAVLDARLQALRTVIGLDAAQQKLWPPIEDAIRNAAKDAAARREARAKAGHPKNFVDILDRTADAEAQRAADLKKVTAALRPLVESLTPEQQRRIPAFLGLRERAGGQAQPTAELWIFEEEE